MPVSGAYGSTLPRVSRSGGGGGAIRKTSSRSGVGAAAEDEASLVPQGSSIADRIAAFNTLKGKVQLLTKFIDLWG